MQDIMKINPINNSIIKNRIIKKQSTQQYINSKPQNDTFLRSKRITFDGKLNFEMQNIACKYRKSFIPRQAEKDSVIQVIRDSRRKYTPYRICNNKEEFNFPDISKSLNPIFDVEIKQAQIFSTGNKPAITIHGEYSTLFEDLKKLKSTGADILQISTDGLARDFLLLLNREQVKNIIHNNLSIFQTRLKAGKETGADEIYNVLISENSPLLNPNYNDLTGLVLGYPKMNSIIFQLDLLNNMTLGLIWRKYNNGSYSLEHSIECVEVCKKNMINALEDLESIYQGLDESVKEEIKAAINKITFDGYTAKYVDDMNYYSFMQYIEEPDEIQRISNSIKRHLEIQEG